ncbi:unnamed protein product [Penicillium salamii]|uniref:D-xylose 1-dehydrogenase (NADP(+), D-xylono-1,5-lactone-forming) n=1 Tax=Penicillium salamii TaxID=1612424 RepID=A0A9W4IRE0_9EURO|nr:unnamed protein product [Penicillium salamii]CAG8143611.1 unnamed protein product [Penicillium salamii]CAG8305128.1 unnamed protein product [Penicillium salamii]CAG8332002.1 unnamed protein product [Penicillium salamii]CAG8355512.1 unnamed protein product [Penicillium salamii]
MSDLPSIRWGIVATGMISTWFVEDILLEWEGKRVNHVVQAIGSSSTQKAQDFVKNNCPAQTPKVYGSYQELYQDPDVDIVYIGTPHAFHYRDCMEAINAGKNVLCEKSFTINAKQAREIFDAARRNNVYVAEAMWVRHRPLYQELYRLLHEEKIIGDVFRVFSDFANGVDPASLPASSRHRDLTLGAGSLLDVGVYALTWGRMALGYQKELPQIVAKQTHEEGVEITTSAILQYSSGRQGICTCTSKALGAPGEVFVVVHGTNGYIEVEGRAASIPESFTVWKKQEGAADRAFFPREACEGKKYDFPQIGRGFVWEAENTALDILEGRKESRVMPWEETLYIMDIMDEIRAQGGTCYPGE